MSQQYIQIENQTLLWKIIQRSPQFLNNTVHINREQWFSNIIKYFYDNKINKPTCSISELKVINQQTITYMLNDLKRIESSNKAYVSNTTPISQHNPQFQLQSPPVQIPTHTPQYETPQTRMSMYNDQFNSRQQEYTNMVKLPAPPIANFTEKVEDEAITNMEELLQQQLKQREYDISTVLPSSPIMIQETKKNTDMSLKSTIQSKENYSEILEIIQKLTKEINEIKNEIKILKPSLDENNKLPKTDNSSSTHIFSSISSSQ